MKILAIETSCDETSVALAYGSGNNIEILSNIVSSQIDIHQKYGGVVPEIAAREHVLSILPVINEALLPLSCKDRTKRGTDIDLIAVSKGPGLITSLITGIETAKTLAYAWDKPLLAINHVEAHIYGNFIANKQKIEFPALILTVSGGHTMLVLMTRHGKYKTLGDTRDDAAGEAFDKAAKLMELDYPGGPIISKQAEDYINNQSSIENRQSKITLPRPMIKSKNFDFSFSGLKTALLYKIQKDKNWKKRIPEYCYEFQQAIIDVLIAKTIKAAQIHQVKTVMLAGGVSANKELRDQMKTKISEKLPKTTFSMPELQYCTDNASMVASAAYFRAKNKKFIPWSEITVDSNFELK